jgi:hypothetical protein
MLNLKTNKMKKNLITVFADWYIINSEHLGSSYYTKLFNDDRDIFISTISEYAIEYALSFKYNPFIVETDKVKEAILSMEENLKNKNSSFEIYSQSKSNHVPRALLGSKNYLKFLEEYFLQKQTLKSFVEPKITIKKANVIFTKEELRKNFFFRLSTQDRFYSFLYYPISVLRKYFYSNDRAFFDNWLNSQINGIQIHTEERVINFSDIQSLEIKSDGKIIINTVSSATFTLHTLTAGSNDKKEHLANTLKNVVIDHVIPFETIMYNLKDKLPTFSLIHNILIELNNGNSLSNREELSSAGNLFVGIDFLKETDVAELKKEMNLISKNTTLQLMDRFENLYKKKYDK